MTRPIVEYRLEPSGNWLVCLGRDDETADEVARFLVTHHGATEARPRDGSVTDNGAGFRGCLECGGDFWAKRRDARYCCAGCRQRASRSRRRDLAPSATTSGAGDTARRTDADDAASSYDPTTLTAREVFTFHVAPAPAHAPMPPPIAARGAGSSARTNGEQP